MRKIRLFVLLFLSLLILPQMVPAQVQSASDSLVLAATDTSLTFETEQRDVGSYFLRVFFVTTFILLFLFAFLYFYKKYAGPTIQSPKSKIQILARQQLGQKQSVVIVIIENKKYALGVTDHSIQLISELGEATAEELSSSEIKPMAQSFATVFSKMQKK